jgi:hypothetical protein
MSSLLTPHGVIYYTRDISLGPSALQARLKCWVSTKVRLVRSSAEQPHVARRRFPACARGVGICSTRSTLYRCRSRHTRGESASDRGLYSHMSELAAPICDVGPCVRTNEVLGRS